MIQTGDLEFVIKSLYGLEGKITRLAGENDNFLIETDTGRKAVLKLADSDTSPDVIDLEYQAVERLIADRFPVRLPRVIPTLNGGIQAAAETKTGRPVHGRLLEFVGGTPWCRALPAGNRQLGDLGRIIGLMHRSLSGLRHPAAGRTHHWDLTGADQHRKKISGIDDPCRRRILEQVFLHFEAIARPAFKRVPHALIHADINDDNILVENGRISGILDFGDCMVNPVVCDLAIALAYHTLDENDPLEAAAVITGAYHDIRPLSGDELQILFPLLTARLAVSVIISNDRRSLDPDRAAWFVSEKRAWKNLERFAAVSPFNAAAILARHTSVIPFEHPGPGVPALLARRRKVIAPSIKPAYRNPVKMVTGRAQYLFDEQHRPFLDLYNNVCHVGHCHPVVVEAACRQMARLNTNTRYLYDGLTDYAERLCRTLPKALSVCFFVNSGSEANELALRIARTCTGHSDFLVVDNAYHGHTTAMIDISPYKFMGKGGKGRPEPWVHVVPVADGYRGPFRGRGPETGKSYGDAVGAVIETIGRPVAGFITESLLSCGGQVIPPDNYFKTAFAHVRRAGGLCIADEVQVGFGRTGTHFWAFEHQGVVPDIVVMGKPMGNGFPMAAVVTRPEIASAFANGMEFFATYGGNPVACAVGMAVLDVIETEKLQARARDTGQYLLAGLERLKDTHDLIGDVRGIGLFIGIELVSDRHTLEPAARQAAVIVNRLRDHGILTGTDGPYDNVIKIKPPMVITRDDADMLVRVLNDILRDSALLTPH